VLKKAQSAIESRIRAAYDWLDDSLALKGGVGEKSLRQIIEQASRLAEHYLPPSQAEPMSKLTSQIITMTDALCELRQKEKGYFELCEINCIHDSVTFVRDTRLCLAQIIVFMFVKALHLKRNT